MNETGKTDRLSRLQQQREALDHKIRSEQKKLKDQERRDDTRRKVVAGAIALAHMEKDEQFKEYFSKILDRFVERPQDRILFGFMEIPLNKNSE